MPRVVFLALVSALGVSLVALAPAHAATHTSTGLRCTKVGTPGNDRIVGTRHRDVICGRGGNDVIAGGGGNDVIDGGPGNDVLSGGMGNDTVLGSTGNDRVDGGAGNDVESGGTGNDSVVGSLGNDRLAGDGGNDHVDGGSGSDVLGTGDGNDVAHGGDGNDRVSAGPGNDTAYGDAGSDTLYGEAGDDDLIGGAGGDTLYGGPGTNWCDAVASESRGACKSDLEAPRVVSAHVSRSDVDVTDAPATVAVIAHVTDDTGVRSVDGGRLISGTVRDGWWRRDVVLPRFTAPGPTTLYVTAVDRVGRNGFDPEPLVVQVADRRPDLEAPVVRTVSLSADSVDVRNAARTVTATVRVTDAVSGATGGYVCLNKSVGGAYLQDGACPSLVLISGTAHDGLYRASLTVPARSSSGTWNVSVVVQDLAWNQEQYLGPDMYATLLSGCHEGCVLGPVSPTPSGAGRLTVVGSGQDAAPQLTSLLLSPAQVDTRQGAVQETVTFHATDDVGVTGAGLDVRMDAAEGGQVELFWGDATLVSGTPQDGTWQLTFTVPGGAAAGTYELQAWVTDKDRTVSWFSPGYRLDGVQRLTPAIAPAGTELVVQ